MCWHGFYCSLKHVKRQPDQQSTGQGGLPTLDEILPNSLGIQRRHQPASSLRNGDRISQFTAMCKIEVENEECFPLLPSMPQSISERIFQFLINKTQVRLGWSGARLVHL
jgi:hypothetical protein